MKNKTTEGSEHLKEIMHIKRHSSNMQFKEN